MADRGWGPQQRAQPRAQGQPVTGHLTGAYRAGHFRTRLPGWCLTWRFDQEVIDALKAAVPGHERSYDPETKEWWIAAQHEDTLLRLFPNFEPYLRQLPLL